MKALLKRIAKWGHALSSRADLWLELQRSPTVAGAWSDILFQPTAVDDALLLRRFVGPEQDVLLVDVGGNTGEWAAKMVRFFPKSRLIAFEPDTRVCAEYRRRFLGSENLVLHEVGLSDHSTEAKLHLAADSRHSSLDDLGGLTIGDVPVRLRRLDDFYETIRADAEGRFSILKIDVQGHELQVLQGGGRAIDLFDVIYLECSFAGSAKRGPTFGPACATLLARGFYPAIFRDFGRSLGPHAVERDVIFTKLEMTARIRGF
jgi:FkbM family methyltransferase